MTAQPTRTGGGRPSPVSLFQRWIRLFLAFALIAVCLYLAPNLERLPVVGSRITDLRESGINVGAWYYDDVQEYFEAEQYVREKRGLDYPRPRDQTKRHEPKDPG